MSALVSSCSSTGFHTVPLVSGSQITNSPSMPDVNDFAMHELIGTLLAACSPISLALIVLKAEFLELTRRAYILEDENRSLKLANTGITEDLSRLRMEYNALLYDHKKLTLAAEHDQQKIKSLTSDIDNAQQFIMAMVDIKLHESFLQVAANETVMHGEDAEKSLVKAIAQEADREGSLWSQILSSVVSLRSADSFGAAVDFALQAKQAKDDSLDEDALVPPCRESQILSPNCSIPPSKKKARPPTPFSGSRPSSTSSTHRSPHSSINSDHSKIRGYGICCSREIAQQTKMSQDRKGENIKPSPIRKRAVSETTDRSEAPKQSHSKNLDKRRGIIIPNVAAASVSARENEKGSVLTALSSLERICALLSSSDLGSLEETSDDESRCGTCVDSSGSFDLDKHLTESSAIQSGSHLNGDETIKTDRPTGRTVEVEDPPSDVKMARKRGQSCLVPDSPLSSISTFPPSTPLESSFSSDRLEITESSPTSTAFSDIGFPVRPELKAASLNLPGFPVVSGITRRLSRVVTNAQANVFTKGTPYESASLLGNNRFRSSSLTSMLKSPSLAKASKLKSNVSPTSRTSSPITTIPARNTGSLSKFGPAKGTGPKAEPAATPTSTQEQKLSVGRTILRRLSNLPGSVSRTRFSPSLSELSQRAEAKRTANFVVTSSAKTAKPPSQTGDSSPKHKPVALTAPVLTATNGVPSAHGPVSASTPRKTKPRSNTVNDFSPEKPSPLSKNVVTSSSKCRSSWKRQSVQVAISNHTKVTPTTRPIRAPDTDKTVPLAAPTSKPERRASIKPQRVMRDVSNPPAATPTAAFMKPVSDRSTTKVAKRMTNSIKPLIPTWTAGSSSPSQCDNMFRNSLSMTVR